MSDKLFVKLDQIKELNEKTHDVVLADLGKFNKGTHPVNSILFISYELAKRFSILVKATNLFIDNLKKDISYEMQIGLLLRPALLDVLAYIFITDEFLEKTYNTQQFEWILLKPKIEKLLGHNLIKYKKETDKFFEDKYIDAVSYKNTINNLIKVSTDVFGKNILSNSKDFIFPNASSLYNELTNTVHSKKYAPVYYLYSHYSKYEHFGLLTTLMPNEKSNSFEDIVFRLVQSTGFINKVIILAFTFLQLDCRELNKIEKNLKK